jgi:hypothetical protein
MTVPIPDQQLVLALRVYASCPAVANGVGARSLGSCGMIEIDSLLMIHRPEVRASRDDVGPDDGLAALVHSASILSRVLAESPMLCRD